MSHWWSLFVLAIVALGFEAAVAQPTANWKEIGRLTIDGKAATAVSELRSNEDRTLAIRLLADKDIVLDQIDIAYASGRVDYVREAVSLKKDTPSSALATRATGVIVQTITVRSREFTTKAPLTIKVFGSVAPAAVDQPQVSITEERRSPTPPDKAANKTYEEVGVHYATNRKREDDRTKNEQTLVSFSGEPGGTTTTGYAVVTVPKQRTRGTIPRPMFDLVLRFRKEDPSKEFTLASVKTLSAGEFQQSVGAQAKAAGRFKGQAFVFIHGFNVAFDDALYHAAQIVHDTEFDGAAVVFSWPSRGNLLAYIYDRERARTSASALRDFLGALASNPDLQTINVIAHSMGNEPLVDVIKEQAAIGRARGNVLPMKLGEVIFVAPDVGRDAFSELKETLGLLGKGRGTLYASEKDIALGLSGIVVNPVDRAGYIAHGKAPLIVRGIESIDMTKAGWFFGLNHSTFSERRHLLADIQVLFEKHAHPPTERSTVFLEYKTELGPYWKYD